MIGRAAAARTLRRGPACPPRPPRQDQRRLGTEPDHTRHFRWTSPLGYVYEVTHGGTWLECTPDLGPQPSPIDKTIHHWCDTIADATDLARCG